MKVYWVTGPTETPSTKTFATLYPALGVIAKFWFVPAFSDTNPDGVIAPFGPAEALIV